jgi:hypothetical protein
MRRGEHELLLRGVVELDESLVGGRERGSGKRGRTSKRKTLVAVSAEKTPQGGLGRAHLRVIDDVSAKTLTKAAGATIELGSIVKTDGWRAYRALPNAGYLQSYLDKFSYRLNRRDQRLDLFRRILDRCVLYTPPTTYFQLIAA